MHTHNTHTHTTHTSQVQRHPWYTSKKCCVYGNHFGCYADTNEAPEGLQAKLYCILETYMCVYESHTLRSLPICCEAALQMHIWKNTPNVGIIFWDAYHSSHACLDLIIESVDSICRDSRDTQYMTIQKISPKTVNLLVFIAMYHPSLSVFMTNKTPSGTRKH